MPWQPPTGEQLLSSDITSLLAARDGTLWIGTFRGLASWKDGKLIQYHELDGQNIAALLEDREGTVWVGTWTSRNGKLCEIYGGRALCHGEDGSLGSGVLSLCEDSRGNLWAGASTGLWRWNAGPPKLYPMPVTEFHDLIEGDNGAILITLPDGIRQFIDGKVEPYLLPGSWPQFRPVALLRDHEGSLWIGTRGRGLLHVHQGRLDLFAQTDGLSSDQISRHLFVDREDNIWVPTDKGLDRFRDFAAVTISVKQGLSIANVSSVLSAKDGSVWLGTSAGLNRWNNGEISIYRKHPDLLSPPAAPSVAREVIDGGVPDHAGSLFQDDQGRVWVFSQGGVAYFETDRFTPVSSVPGGIVHSVAGDKAGNLWISDQDHGLYHLLRGKLVERIPWAKLGGANFAYSLSTDPVRGGVWLGFYEGGVAYFRDGQIRASYQVADGLGKGTVNEIRLDRDGTLWAATEGGLSRVQNGRIATLTSLNGLPCDAVHWVIEDDSDTFWLYMPCGLVRIDQSDLRAWGNDPKRKIRAAVFGSSDGVSSLPLRGGFSPQVAKTEDGKLWFLPGDGVSVIDPHHLPFNKLPPPVHIQQITADRKTYDTSSDLNEDLRLPPLIRDLEIDYTALSLVAPEKNQFRYRLEGHDRDWQDVGNRRQAFYNDLPPGNYRFRIVASNNSGVWNETGASLDFSIAPAYWQTTWFRALCVAAILAFLWMLYRLRMRQLAHEFDASLEERVAERTRIARELHDTLLQSFNGLLLRFRTVHALFSKSPDQARTILEEAIDETRQALTEGRQSVQGLRSSLVGTHEFSEAIQTLTEELASHPTHSGGAEVRLNVEGTPRKKRPLIRDEIYRIASEALRNAFHHAEASHIEVQLSYGEKSFELRVRDDGKGIDPTFLTDEGRTGHFGLRGMRERAQQIGGQLTVWSAPGAGTEVVLSIPGALAYDTAKRARRFWPLGAFTARPKEPPS